MRTKTNMRIAILLISIMLSSFSLSAYERDTVFVSNKYSVHMAFSSEIRYVDISKETPVLFSIIDGYTNLLSLKCSDEFDRLSNLTVMLSSGEIKTFILKYKEDDIDLLVDKRDSSTNESPSLEDILSMDKQYYHIGTRKNGILVLCDVI